MDRTGLAPTLIAGVLAGSAFLLVAFSGLGFFFMFLPTLPLFYEGLSRKPLIALAAAFVAGLLIALVTNASLAILFLLTFGLPSWYMARLSLWWKNRPDGEGLAWFPLGQIMVRLTVFACAFLALITLFYASQQQSITELLSQEIHQSFSDMDSEYKDAIDLLARQWSFLIFAITIWLWGMALYAHGWFTQRMLLKLQKNIRPDFTVAPFSMPNWMLSLLMICALASLLGSESFAFVGNTALIALMLPYFFLGAAWLNQASQSWSSRGFFLFFIYFFVFSLLWPALLLSGAGLWYHIKHLSARPTSSRS